jgi:hypothetical protein
VAGEATNVQISVKDSKRYAESGLNRKREPLEIDE